MVIGLELQIEKSAEWMKACGILTDGVSFTTTHRLSLSDSGRVNLNIAAFFTIIDKNRNARTWFEVKFPRFWFLYDGYCVQSGIPFHRLVGMINTIVRIVPYRHLFPHPSKERQRLQNRIDYNQNNTNNKNHYRPVWGEL